MPLSPIHSWDTPEGSEQPQVHLDLASLAAQIDADVPVADATTPTHKNGRIWVDLVTKITWVSDGTIWRPLGEHTMGKVFGGVSGGQALPLGWNTMASLTCNLVAGPAVLHLTGSIQNGSSGAPRNAYSEVWLDGAVLGQGCSYYVTNSPVNDTMALSYHVDFTATAGSHVALFRGSASAASAVVALNYRMWITQGGLG